MTKVLLSLMLFTFLTNLLRAEVPLEVGAKAPQLQAVDHTGATIDLGKALNDGTTLVFFYPKAHTGGCTKQACSLRDAWDELQQRDVKVFGVSSDTAETQASFKDKFTLPFTLIADTDQKVTEAFHKSRWSRQAYIFRDGTLVWRDLNASTSEQAADALTALDALP
ncbi:peroxiredoxin [Coraliomargarita parva]|uniref:peroxiredoxin n=1 Tax=Coraliomargarita parva TaxID=3014050 RepID=UPI0022B33666|nr:peroxiredoxin [Coraliomargarita parva]